jgi:PAS domain S-box-containing protein
MRFISKTRVSRHAHYPLIAFGSIIILIIPFFSISMTAAAEKTIPKVLILDSYHQAEDWSDNEIEGIRIAFNEVYPYLIPSIEHMDTKRFPNHSHLILIKNFLKSKYLDKQFDIIMPLDNSALNLMLRYGDELFPKVPIVFAGVNGYRPDMLEGHANVTGVAEVQDMEGTLRLALKINPKIKTVLAVHDYTSSGIAVRRDMESAAEKLRNQVAVEYTPEGTVNDLVAQLKALQQDTVVLLLTYVTDKNGRTLTREESTRLITTASPVPVYAMHETRLGYGIVGGMLLEGREHGRQAAAQALRILAGEEMSQIFVENSRSRPVFDFKILGRFNISEKLLPTDSVIINRPVSFWRQYRTIWIPGVVIIGVLVISTVMLSKTVMRMQVAEKSLRDAIQLNKEIIDSAQEGIIVYDLDLLYRVWNPFMEKLSGIPAKNVLGLHPLEVFSFHKETQLMKVLERALDGETPEPIDFPFSLPDSGLSGWTSDQSGPLRNANGDIIGVLATVRDITSRKESEEKLRRNEKLLQNIIDSSADYIYVKDTCLRTMLCNRTFARAVGKDPQEMVGKTDIENGWLPEFVIGNPDRGIRGFENDDKDALSGKTVHIIDELGNVNDKVRSFDTIKMPLMDENGTIIGMFGISRDITERQQVKEDLLKQKHFLQKAQEIGKIGTWELNIPENELLWTDENYRIFGLPLGTALTYETFLGCVHPDDREYVDTEWKASFTGKPYDIEHRLLIDGKVTWVREKAELTFDEKGECIRGIGFTQDITHRKHSEIELLESEEKFRNFTEQSFVGFYIIQNGLFKYVNPKFADIFGYTVDECLDGMHFRQLVHPEDLATVQEQVRKRVDGEIESVQYTFRGVKKNGEIIHVSIYGSSLIYMGREAAIGTMLDITKQLELEQRTQQNQKLESIGALAGGIAHDFNNILASVIGFTELALDEVERNTTIEDSLQEVYAAGKRAKDLVGQILAFARQSDEELKPIQVISIVEEVLKFIRSSIPTTIEIHQNIESDSLIMGNATRVHQVMMNLCTNAAHAMDENGGILEIGLKDVSIDSVANRRISGLKPGDYIELKISDTGAGIDPKIIGSIFEPYFTTKAPGEGTGMGLAMAHGIVETYGGKITVDSRLGEGTAFTIYLPITRKRQEHRPYVQGESPLGTEKVLFIDDEASIAKMGSQVLERLGYQVTTRTSSVEALKLFKSKPNEFDLVITDMTMPNMTGDALAVELMKTRPDIPVILCTGYSNKISDEVATELGIKAFAYKPIVKADLAKTVRKVLDEASEIEK